MPSRIRSIEETPKDFTFYFGDDDKASLKLETLDSGHWA